MITEKSYTIEESRTVRSIKYNSADQEIDIEYNTGKVYRYSGFSRNMWNRALSAERIGTFVNENIKGHFEYRLLG
jgi:hypothetical protein